MIRITCTHCRYVLTIDDGFAGGVCRCQHCGTIQTVPVLPTKAENRGAVPAAKTLYRTQRKDETAVDDQSHGPGSGLDEIAEIVSSSGLSSNSRRLRQSTGGNGSRITLPAKTKFVPLLIVAGLLLMGVIAALVWLKMSSSSRSQGASPLLPAAQTSAPLPAPTPIVVGPNFAGLPLTALDTVIYLIDDGGSASDILPAMQAATYQSIKSLGKDRRFKVILWRDGSPMYPADGTARSTDQEEAKCEAALHEAYGQGNTEIDTALKTALSAQPDAIVLITAKGAQLTDDFTQTVLTLRGDSHVRVYTVGINGDSTATPATSGVLATIADKTGGRFLNISSADLNRLGR